jgi:hypothetical protein
MKKPPKFLRQYFWEIDFESLDVDKYPGYVIKRILEYGDERAIRWMGKNFNLNEIKEIVHNTRDLSPKSAYFWAVVLNIEKKGVRCLSRDFRKIYRTIWPY